MVAAPAQALLMAAEVPVRPKLASRRNVAGPSEPGRGSRGATKAGQPVKFPWFAAASVAFGPSKFWLKPLAVPMLDVAPEAFWSLVPLPENMLALQDQLVRRLRGDAHARPADRLGVVLPEDVVGDVGLRASRCSSCSRRSDPPCCRRTCR